MPSLPSAILESWQYTVHATSHGVVLPDGCRDLILVTTPGEPARWMVSALDDTARAVARAAGQCFWGYRLHPGALVDEGALLGAIEQTQPRDPHDALALVDALVRVDSRVEDALDSLKRCPCVASAARQLGVSERSLQRLVTSSTGRAPGYWKNLARVRRAAQVLSATWPDAPPLAQLAADHGYADQAHMSRAFRHWLGCTPSALLASPTLRELVRASGYE